MTLELGIEQKLHLKEINSLLTCTLCNGYYIDATTFDCLHTFCRSCILSHFETSKQQTCPTCGKKKSELKPDHQLQALVYKMVPGLFCKETQRREEFYRSSVRASSICSDDSVLGELRPDQDKCVSTLGYQENYFSPEDPISLSLEFYQSHLDDTNTEEFNQKLCAVTKRSRSRDSRAKLTESECDKYVICEIVKGVDRRYLQCPAAVSMTLLQKFLRMKYGLSPEHRVDIIYEGEVLPLHYTLMDVAYTFNWKKLKPMRFFYRIFTPMKVQPIKIINTSSSNGSKQLQIVPVRPNADAADVDKSKEQFVAQLKLQSKHKSQTQTQSLTTTTATTQQQQNQLLGINDENCVYEYEEPDKEEIKKFAESRDREWARMRHEDQEPSSHHVKKRKKNKHSKGDVKKPKIHAEITSDVKQESIKLKVKLTPAHNGHKHKHRTPQIVVETTPKEASLQLQKPKEPTLPTPPNLVDVAKPKSEGVRKLNEIIIKKQDALPTTAEGPSKVEKKDALSVDVKKETIRPVNAKSPKLVEVPKQQEAAKRKFEEQKTFLEAFHVNASPRQSPVQKVQSVKVEPKKPLNTYPNQNQTKQNLEKKIAALQQQQQLLQKQPAKPTQNQVQPPKVINNAAPTQQQPKPQQQQKKLPNDVQPKDKKVSFASEKPHILNSQQYHAFTVSKVEQGVKRKAEDDGKAADKDKRPSLEITLINPKLPKSTDPLNQYQQRQNARCFKLSENPQMKRPPPGTIPLDRIKKSSMKSPVNPSKMADAGDSGALDLSKKIEPAKTNGITLMNGVKTINGIKPTTVAEKNALSNLQMLSKVAASQASKQNNNNLTNNNNKVRPQIPNLQTLRVPVPPTPQRASPNLANLPELNEIKKSTFKMVSPTGAGNHTNNIVRNVVQRANTQNVTRSIPNPSLLVRQHNQNRLTLNGQHKTLNGASNANATTQKDQPKILNILAKENTINNKELNSKDTLLQANKINNNSSNSCAKVQVLDEREKSKMQNHSINNSLTNTTSSMNAAAI